MERKFMMEPVILLTFSATLLICFEKFRLRVMVSPKYLNSETHSISLPSNNITGRLAVGLEVNIISLLFDALGTNLFALRYPAISEKRFLILPNNPSRVSADTINAASSANKTVISSTAKGKSLMNRLKHNGPRIDPCGTPVFTVMVIEL